MDENSSLEANNSLAVNRISAFYETRRVNFSLVNGSKFGSLEKIIKKTIDISLDEISWKNSQYNIFGHKRNEEFL